jgi:Spy/CpxP family protein refolding chaperone
MKRITELLRGKILMGGLLAALLLVTAQAQGARLNQQKQKKLAQQSAATPAESTTQQQTEANQPPQNRPKALPPRGNPRVQAIVLDQFLPRIDLSQQQNVQVRQLRFQHIRKMRTMLDMERVHTRAYDEALFDPTLDQREIEKRTHQLAEIRTDLLNAQARFFIELRQILTPEQFAKLRQLMEEERALRMKNTP